MHTDYVICFTCGARGPSGSSGSLSVSSDLARDLASAAGWNSAAHGFTGWQCPDCQARSEQSAQPAARPAAVAH